MTEQLAQVPDAVISKGADQLFNYGVLGVVCVVLLITIAFGVRWLKGCIDSSAERTTSIVTVVQEQRDAGRAAAAAMTEMARRLEMVERALERLNVRQS